MDLMEAFEVYRNIPKPIIIKADMVRLGSTYSEVALEEARKIKDIRFKSYGIFSFDISETVLLKDMMPAQIYLEDGSEDGIYVQFRLAHESPYLIDFMDGKFVVKWNGEWVANVDHFCKQGKFANRAFSDGTPYEACVFSGADDMLFVVANKHCDYFSKGLECQFCDLTHQAAAQKKGGEAMVLRKQADRVAEVLDVGLHEKRYRHIIITGGTLLSTYQDMSGLEWYANLLDTIRKKIRVWYPACIQIEALDDEGWKRIHDTGVPTIQPNIEVWDKRLFEIICPGKAKTVGYDEWIKRVINAVKYWGPGNVNPNFVTGVEMAQPFGFKKWEDAVKSTLSGYDFLMSNGVVPRQGDMWCREPKSKLAGQPAPPLEYYLEIGLGYLELTKKYNFPASSPSLCRRCIPHGTEYDFEYFEYFHDNSVASKDDKEKSPKGGEMPDH